jgi:diguanylate cyclase (GGDEF)-like protein
VHLFGVLLTLLLLGASQKLPAQPGIPTLINELKAMETRVHSAPEEVLLELKEALPTVEKADSNTRLLYLLRRAQAHNALYMVDAFEDDLAEAQSQLLLAGGSAELTLWIQSYAGIIEIRRGELKRGVDILANVAERALARGPSRVYVFAVQELAYTRGLLEQYHESLEDLHKAYEIAVELEQQDLVAMVDDAYGAIYGYLNDYPRAITYYNKALAEFMRLGYKAQIASVVLGIASTYRYAGEWDLAEDNYNRYLEYTRYALGENHLFLGNYGLAMTIASRGDCDRAVPLINRALALDGPVDYDAELYKKRAMCSLKQGDVASGEADLQQARQILTAIPELKGTSWLLDLKYIESLLLLAEGNSRQAFEQLERYHQQAMQQTLKRSSDRMNMLRAGLENSRKDLEITLLEQQAEVDRLRIASYARENEVQRNVILAAIGLVLLILTGSFIQWRSNRRITELSYRDGLSGLYNRKYTFEYLEEVLPKIRVEHGGLSIILIDVDNFKSINDQFGHPVGDQVIKRVAAIGEASLRSRDVMGRIGGEEFLCVLPRTTSEQSMQVAERLLAAMSAETFLDGEGQPFSVSISIGVANYDKSVANVDDLYNRADKALYRAKTAGKGRIATYGPASALLAPS